LGSRSPDAGEETTAAPGAVATVTTVHVTVVVPFGEIESAWP
jgi:hypothetical protein